MTPPFSAPAYVCPKTGTLPCDSFFFLWSSLASFSVFFDYPIFCVGALFIFYAFSSTDSLNLSPGKTSWRPCLFFPLDNWRGKSWLPPLCSSSSRLCFSFLFLFFLPVFFLLRVRAPPPFCPKGSLAQRFCPRFSPLSTEYKTFPDRVSTCSSSALVLSFFTHLVRPE